jgi:pimeloyl-ACP methyl ester carboxylesterase
VSTGIYSRTTTRAGAKLYKTPKLARGLALAVMASFASLSVATPAMAAAPAETPAPTVTWGACPDDVPDPLKQLQCALVPVPLDYSDPDGTMIDIMISRLASASPEDRRGILVLNPGGPGESGLTQPIALAKLGLPLNVQNAYDLIGMDTRGIHHSAPISCGFTVEQNYTGAVPHYAADSAAVAAEAEIVKGIAAQCAANDVNGTMAHITTANTARDLDVIREALGEEKLSFYGVSYGTALGAAYASLFPDRSDRIVLDSAIGDTYLDQDGFRRYGLGAEETFPDFANWLSERDGTYQLGSTPDEVREMYFTLAAQLDETPMAAGILDGHLFRLTTFVSMYNESIYSTAAQMWEYVRTADEGGVTGMLVDDGFMAPDGTATAGALTPNDNSYSDFLAVTCNDSEFSDDISVYQEAVIEDRERYPVFGAATANMTPCAYWAHEPSEPPVEIVDDGPENILIVQNMHDPVTPYAGGVMLSDKFEERSTLVSVDGTGHGVYIYGDSACADNITTRFLVDGTMPKKDVNCG